MSISNLSLCRKSKIKEAKTEEDAPEFKIKKEETLTPSTSLCIDYSPPSSSSPSSDNQSLMKSPTRSIKKEDIWYSLEDGGEIKDLLPAGMIKNSSKLRFDVKEISLAEEV